MSYCFLDELSKEMKIELPGVPGIREADGAASQLSLDEPLRILALWMNMLLLLCG